MQNTKFSQNISNIYEILRHKVQRKDIVTTKTPKQNESALCKILRDGALIHHNPRIQVCLHYIRSRKDHKLNLLSIYYRLNPFP